MTAHGAAAPVLQKLGTALAQRAAARPWRWTVAAPLAPAERVWDAVPGARAWFWETAEGTWAGLGEAVVVEGTGAGRLHAVVAALGRLRAAGWEEASKPSGPSPSLFGGAAFAPQARSTAPWEGFGDARFVLPRWTYHRGGGRASLTLALPPGEAAAAKLATELSAILGALAAPGVEPRREDEAVELCEEDDQAWVAAVAAARAAIDAGRLAKVVLVRRTGVRLASSPPGAVLLRRLGEEGAGLFRFGLRCAGAAFVGASPELLVARRGAEVRAEALAASVPRPADAGAVAEEALAARLLADGKQRLEHDLVVDAVRRALAPVCAELAVPATPEVRVLRHLLHLSTPVRGTLRHAVAVLDLAARLHPTPAVAGEPREQALSFIAAHERYPRGWFAGPVGRAALDGDGELAVALRSALVRGREAFVYAGAGIVAGSRAELELAEIRAKSRTCLAALGVHA